MPKAQEICDYRWTHDVFGL